jgi:protein-S-isoprenylcysteine O-methyltransferase Ste14
MDLRERAYWYRRYKRLRNLEFLANVVQLLVLLALLWAVRTGEVPWYVGSAGTLLFVTALGISFHARRQYREAACQLDRADLEETP